MFEDKLYGAPNCYTIESNNICYEGDGLNLGTSIEYEDEIEIPAGRRVLHINKYLKPEMINTGQDIIYIWRDGDTTLTIQFFIEY